MTEFITIATFIFVYEILVLKTILDREDNPLFVSKWKLSFYRSLTNLSYGGIQLKIHPNDIKIVQQILDGLNNNLKIV